LSKKQKLIQTILFPEITIGNMKIPKYF